MMSKAHLPHTIGYFRVVCLLVLLQKLLKHMSIGRFYPLVVLLLGLHNVEAKLLVKLNCTLVVHLGRWQFIHKCKLARL